MQQSAVKRSSTREEKLAVKPTIASRNYARVELSCQ
jgi:hypothetical protein